MDPNDQKTANDNIQQGNPTDTNQNVPDINLDSLSKPPVQNPVEADPNSVSGTQPANPGVDNYVDNVGGSFIDLLNDIISNDGFMTQVAKEMNIPVEQASAIANKIQEKINQNQLTKEEIAFILSATIVDDPLAIQGT